MQCSYIKVGIFKEKTVEGVKIPISKSNVICLLVIFYFFNENVHLRTFWRYIIFKFQRRASHERECSLK